MDSINTSDIQLENKSSSWGYKGIVMAIIAVVIVCIVLIIYNTSKDHAKPTETKSVEPKEVAKPVEPQAEVKPAESFTNDLPNENVKIEEQPSYSDAMQEMALDASVIKQHANYVNERNKITSTASFNPSRSDTQDVVPFVGLRRPQYSFNNKDLVDSTARVVPSEVDANQLSKHVELRWS